MVSPRMAPAAADPVPVAHPMEGASPESKRPKTRADATPTAIQRDLTLPRVIAGLGDLHGRVNRDEEYVANVHEVTATGHMKQLGRDAEENDVKLDNKLREELNQVTTRLEEKNTELMNNLALSEKGIWEKIDPLTASILERPPVQPERPPGFEPGRLLALEGGFKELSGHFNAVSLAQATEITGTQAQVSAMASP